MKLYIIQLRILLIVIILGFGCAELPDEPEKLQTGTISGKVTESNTNKGLHGVSITTTPATKTVLTDSIGNYSISNIDAGTYTVKAQMNGYEDNSITVDLGVGGTVTANLQLSQEKGSISGKVTDATSGTGISGATITTTPPTQTVTTNSSGDYTITNVTPTTYTIKANKSGYGEGTASVSVTAGGTVTANIQISQEKGSIIGRVTDATSGAVISGVTITTSPSTQTVTTNSSGDYTLNDITPGSYTVKANKSGYGEGSGSVNVTAGGTATANIQLTQEKGSISGKVTDATSGTGISGVTITTNPSTQTVTTNSSGEYSISNITPGSYTVKANKSGYGEGTGSVNVTAGGSATANIQLSIEATLPVVTTSAITNVTTSSASGGGDVTSGGSTSVTARGVCWSTSQNPTINDSKTTNGSGTGSFTSSLSGLSASTNYYVRAYATNGSGTNYGNQVSFTTTGTKPTVTTASITNVTTSTASGGGNVTSGGSTSVTARGVCWSTSQNPTINNSKTNNGSGTGSFTSSISGLSASTTYYVRAYATNGSGTNYGNQVSFTTTSNDDHSDSYQGATVIVSNAIRIDGIINPPGDIDYFKFTLDANTKYTIETHSHSNNNSMDTFLSLYDIGGTNRLRYDDDAGIGTLSKITFIPNSSGYYFSSVKGYSSTVTGYYSISVSAASSFICGTSTVDYEGGLYETILIGNQCWLKKNLNIGVRINGSQDQTNNGYVEKYCYNNLESNCDTYGGLYQWNEAMKYTTDEGTQGICPDGWHIPTQNERNILVNFVGEDGNKLKREDQGSGDGAGTNTSGFSALLSGSRSATAEFNGITSDTFILTSTESSSLSITASDLYLWKFSSLIQLFGSNKLNGKSIRCLRD